MEYELVAKIRQELRAQVQQDVEGLQAQIDALREEVGTLLRGSRGYLVAGDLCGEAPAASAPARTQGGVAAGVRGAPAPEKRTLLNVEGKSRHDAYAKLPREPDRHDQESHEVTIEDIRVSAAGSHAVEANAWEASLLVGLPALGGGGSMGILLAVLLNALVQSIFCYGLPFFCSGSLPSVASISHWRETSAHDPRYMQGGITLASRVCSGDASLIIADSQSEIVADGRVFITEVGVLGLRVGQLVSLSAMLCWAWTVSMELLKTCSFASALLNLPRGRTTLLHNDNTDGFLLVEVTRCRLACTLLVQAVRITIALVLLVSGITWLSRTIAINDLIVNTVALDFVLHVDEMIFSCFSSFAISEVIQKLHPLPMNATRHRTGCGFPTVFSTLATLAMLVVAVQSGFDYRVERLTDIYEAACGGNRDFVVGVQGSTGVVYAAHTSPFGGEEDRSSLRQHITREIVSSADPSNVTSISWTSNLHYFDFRMFQSTEQVVGMYTVCQDVPEPWPVALAKVLQDESGKPHASSCEDLKEDCEGIYGVLTRLNCPLTCGCASPRSGLYFSKEAQGCPSKVCQSSAAFQSELEETPCRNLDREQLQAHRGWNAHWDQWRQFWTSSYPEMADYLKSEADNFRRSGCDGKLMSLWDDFCTEDAAFSSVQAFCPISCGCHHANLTNRQRCPLSCMSSEIGE